MSERRCKFTDGDGVVHERCRDCNCVGSPVVCLPLMTKPASNPFEGRKFLPEMWKPSDG